MYIIIQPSSLRRVRTTNEPATRPMRIELTPQLSILLELCWKPWEALADVTAAWIDVRFDVDAAWIRLGDFPMDYLARSYEDDQRTEV